MWILTALVVVAVLLVLLPRFRTLRSGVQLNSQLLSGRFDDTDLGRQFASWFHENPNRELQRQRFVQLASAMGCPSGQLSERVMRSTMRAWKEPDTGYGSILAEQIDDLIVFDSPVTDAQRERQKVAASQLENFKSEIRRLDK